MSTAGPLEPFVALSGQMRPEDAEAQLKDDVWAVVLDTEGLPAVLLSRQDLVQGCAAGAQALLHDSQMRLSPTAIVSDSMSLEEIVNSAAVEILETAHGLVVVRDDDQKAIVGVLSTETISAYLGGGGFQYLPRTVMGSESRLPGVPLLRSLQLQCARCGFVNGFDAFPRRLLPKCQRPGADHAFELN